ncbi:MAG TPA: ubiquinol-cytochrome C chaperone family protein [Methylobacterium sp.]|jgi:cytochrome b pre-mRNA-processing protein 3|uniref:ubiquinol-cytochrome C chaperone family protein n=1 Tax=Methylorubrum sp. B1-46 TaxID=2897334 RepID=UPI001E4C6F63|nr:ubiquinol-cytochrome C chaperone family protein [Methylorubrum sp. B1-46]UGB27948.1 ubiquinol-cytochrome C chaperone [Methylorubrum sp. B1-46]HEV2542333.1 ubiquinol-cytochrome C chaperone family protein [Methylobacterium sp.]
MLTGLFRRADRRRRTVRTLHQRIGEAGRRPGLYTALGVPDTVEGRFEALSLHVILVLRRLGQLPPPAADVAQDLVDSVFMQLDASLRELGIGDMGVPKRIKKLGASFYARAGAYGAALDAGDRAGLAAVLARNVLDGTDAGAADPLAAYVETAAAALTTQDLDGLLEEGPRFPEPAVAREDSGDHR